MKIFDFLKSKGYKREIEYQKVIIKSLANKNDELAKSLYISEKENSINSANLARVKRVYRKHIK